MTQPAIEKIDVGQIGDKNSYIFFRQPKPSEFKYSKANHFRRISLEQ